MTSETPAEAIRRAITLSGCSHQEFAKKAGMNAFQLSHILGGRRSITPKTAIGLEKATGIAAELWLTLQVSMNLKKRREVRDA